MAINKAMATLGETLRKFVDDVAIVDKHYSPAIYRAIEAVATGDSRYPTLLLGLAAQQLGQQGIPPNESAAFLIKALSQLKPLHDIEYELVIGRFQLDKKESSSMLPAKIHSIATGEQKYNPPIILYQTVADMLESGGYSADTALKVLKNGTQNAIAWRDRFSQTQSAPGGN